MKFGTLVDLYEKLPNTKFEANLTSMSRVMAITNFGLEAKMGKIGLTQESVDSSILKIAAISQRILIRIFHVQNSRFEVILIYRNFRGRPSSSNFQPRFSKKTPLSISLKFWYIVGMTMRNKIKKVQVGVLVVAASRWHKLIICRGRPEAKLLTLSFMNGFLSLRCQKMHLLKRNIFE